MKQIINKSRWVRGQRVEHFNAVYFINDDGSIEFCKPKDTDYSHRIYFDRPISKGLKIGGGYFGLSRWVRNQKVKPNTVYYSDYKDISFAKPRYNDYPRPPIWLHRTLKQEQQELV